jgi:hypothetical protein
MENITFITDIDGAEHAIIEHADGSFTSMTKATYEAQQAEQSTPSVIHEAKAK